MQKQNSNGTTLRLTKKTFQDQELPLELPLTTRQKIKIRNAFANNMSTDIKVSKAELSKIIQSRGSGFANAMLSKFPGLLMKAGVPLINNFWTPSFNIA